MSYDSVAATITNSLGLTSPPIALAFVDAGADRVASAQAKAAPSACSFWRDAETDVFFASAEAHFNCPIGAMVMGFDLPKIVSDELEGLVNTMGNCGYISAEEPVHIPTRTEPSQGVIYGPLAQFPLEPSVVLCWLTPFQAMIWNEAGGGAVWRSDTPSTVFGRPACAAIPRSMYSEMPVLSLGCMGMRTFTEIAEDQLLAVIPGSKLAEFSKALTSAKETNDIMACHYSSRKKDLLASEGRT
jgi:uncharacterized protein (DUF169 family)